MAGSMILQQEMTSAAAAITPEQKQQANNDVYDANYDVIFLL